MSLTSVSNAPITRVGASVDPRGLYQLSKTPYPNHLVGSSYVRTGQSNFFNTIQKNVSYSTSSNVANILSSGGNVDIQIKAKSFAIADGLTLQLVIQNSTGAATTLVRTAMLFNYIQILANNGSVQICQIEPEELWADTALYTSEQWACVSQLQNTSSTWGAPTAIANGSTVTYYLPLMGTVFNQAKLSALGLSSDIIVRLNFAPFSITNAASGAAPTLIGCNIIANCTVLDDSDYQAKLAEYMAFPHRFQYLDTNRQLFASQAMNSSTQYQFKLTGVTGRCPLMAIMVRASGATGNNLTNFTDLDGCTIDLVDVNGSSLLGMQVTGTFLRLHEFPERFRYSQFSTNTRVYFISFSADPVADLLTGTNYGYLPLQGNETLRITTDGGFVNASYDVIVLSWICKEFDVGTNGIVSASN